MRQIRNDAVAESGERDRLIVMGADVEAEKQPDWYCLLLADRCVVVEVGMEVRSAVAAVTLSAT